MPRLSWSNRVGLTLAVPCLVLAFVLAGQAVWDARPLPTCLASGLDPLNPAQRCRRVTMLGGVPVTAGATNSNLKMVEQGTVSGVFRGWGQNRTGTNTSDLDRGHQRAPQGSQKAAGGQSRARAAASRDSG